MSAADVGEDGQQAEQCGFCSKGVYSWDDGRKGPCPYCDGAGRVGGHIGGDDR